MRKLLQLAFLAVGFASCTSSTPNLPDETIDRFEGQKITKIKASSAFEVKISQGQNSGASVTLPGNFVKNLVFELDSDGLLTVGLHHMGGIHINPHTKFRLDVECSSLEKVELSGASSATVLTALQTAKLEIDLSGASNFVADKPIDIQGNMDMECSGASHSKIDQLTAFETSIEASGASKVQLGGSTNELDVEVSGASKADCEKLTAQRAKCDVSGASQLLVRATKEITGSASGASSVSCYGGASIRVSTSGASSVTNQD